MRLNLWKAVGAAFVVGLVLHYVIYDVVLARYVDVEPSLRAIGDGPWPKLVAAYLLYGWAFAWLYSHGVHAGRSWVVQGLRFGLVMGLVVHVAGGLMVATHLVHEGEAVIVGAIALGVVMDVVLGLTVAALSGPASLGSAAPA